MTDNAGKYVEEGECSSIAGVSANLYNTYQNQYGGSLEIWELVYHKIQIYHSLAYDRCMFHPTTGHLLNYVCCSLIHNGQKLETIYIPFNRRMDKENLVHLHNGVLLSC